MRYKKEPPSNPNIRDLKVPSNMRNKGYRSSPSPFDSPVGLNKYSLLQGSLKMKSNSVLFVSYLLSSPLTFSLALPSQTWQVPSFFVYFYL